MSGLQRPPSDFLDKYHGEEAQPLYTARVGVSGGTTGHGRASGIARSDDGALVTHLRLPAALGGPGGGTNPEQLFAASCAACFHGALVLLAERRGLVLADVGVEAAVTFARDPVDGQFLLSAEVRVSMSGIDRRCAAELVRGTERICPYTKLFRGGIEHVVSLAPEPEPEPAIPSGRNPSIES
ncbi:Ohr family peroxiredoxin [Dokdonella sp.]|uniref:Ohr family peroxiredoxin n=1 Tax=Dokdonella sp. TaxID=2291710 RepID=UPI001B1B4980|nr:Ohr family peroxiredoxin [Dokdonella sp.]MBO9661670.1 Ohr family peroxiredoxin [Dokdonella sp.]